MHRFDDVSEVESVIVRLPELIVKLPRRPGEKEPRYAHLLSGEPVQTPMAEAVAPPRADRIAALEAEVAQLRQELGELREQFAQFRKQFE
jgi:uncharacterized protein YceH (UPF0502 family)